MLEMISGEEPQRNMRMIADGKRQNISKETEKKYIQLVKVAKQCSKPSPNSRPLIESVKELLVILNNNK